MQAMGEAARRINLDEIEWSAEQEARFHRKMVERALLSEEERAELQWFEWLGVVIRVRALGGTLRTLEKAFGGSRSWWGRQAPIIDDLASQLGQEGFDNPKRIKEALSQMGQETHERWRQMNGWSRQATPFAAPRDGEAERLMSGLTALERLINRNPNDIVADMEPEMRDKATRLAAMVAPWLAAIREDGR
jgi:hypothetical protein